MVKIIHQFDKNSSWFIYELNLFFVIFTYLQHKKCSSKKKSMYRQQKHSTCSRMNIPLFTMILWPIILMILFSCTKVGIKDISQYNDIDECMKIWQYIFTYLSIVAVILLLIIRLGNMFDKKWIRSL